MGKHSNLILVDDQRKIIEGFKHLTPNTNQYRTVMPGFKYETPPNQNKINPYELTGQEVLKYIDFNAGKIAKQLLNICEGFSPLIANEIVNRRQFMTQKHYLMLLMKSWPKPNRHLFLSFIKIMKQVKRISIS